MTDHVYISVSNIEKSLAFYLETLKPLAGLRDLLRRHGDSHLTCGSARHPGEIRHHLPRRPGQAAHQPPPPAHRRPPAELALASEPNEPPAGLRPGQSQVHEARPRYFSAHQLGAAPWQTRTLCGRSVWRA